MLWFSMERLSRTFYIHRLHSIFSFESKFEIRSCDGNVKAYAYEETGGILSKVINLTVFRVLLPLKIVVQHSYGSTFFIFERPANWIFQGEILLKNSSGKLIGKLKEGFWMQKVLIKDPLNCIKAVVKVKSSVWKRFGRLEYDILDDSEKTQIGWFRWKGSFSVSDCEIRINEGSEFLVISCLAAAITVCLRVLRK